MGEDKVKEKNISEDDDEITIDFSKIKNIFRKKNKDKVEDIKQDVKEVEQEIKDHKKSISKETLKKDEQVVDEVGKEVKIEEKKAEELDKKEEDFEKEVEVTKDKIKEVKKDVEDDDEINIDFSKIKNIFKGSDKEQKKVSDDKKQEKTEKDDDEINIDFSKIKNIFKGGDKEQKKVSKTSDDDEDINLDFSKIKNIFKGDKKKLAEEKNEDDISIEWDKAANFLKENKRVVIPAALLTIAIFLSIFLRVQSAYLPITDQWAQDSVMSSIRNQIKSQIDSRYPNLPDQNKNSLIEAEVEKILAEQKTQIDQQIKATSNYFKSRMQDDSGQTYLLAIDPWFWMRHTRNILENGHPGDEIRDGVSWDNHMYAPNGRPVPPDMFHAYFEAFMYNFLKFFNSDIELMRVAFYIPVLLSALAVIPAFFITRRLGGNFGGFIGAAIVAIHPSFLSRTAGGFADTDAYNILLPLMITWFFIIALESKDLKKSLIMSGLSGVFVGFFAYSWGGWWFIFDFVLISGILSLLYLMITRRKNIKSLIKSYEFRNILSSLVVFIISSGIFTTMFKGFRTFIYEPFLSPIGFSRLKEVGIGTVWPNVYTTVAEQNSASLNNVINQIGLGKWLFLLIALIGIVLTLTRLKDKKTWFLIGTIVWYLSIFIVFKPQDLNIFLILISIPIFIRLIIAIKESDNDIDIKYAILLIVWLTSTIYASVKGVRFMLLLVPSFAIGFGIAIGQLYSFLSRYISKGFNINEYISKSVIVIILLLIAGIIPVPFPPFCLGSTCDSAMRTAIQEIPSMNDAWFISLDKINQESSEDAIINSWWDFGHWFKYIGDRAVTFDGTSQNTPQAHWIGHSLLTSDEKTAVGILRMLGCSGYGGGSKAYDSVKDIIKDEPKSVELTYKIIKVKKEEARNILEENNFDDEMIEEVLSYTHCTPPENYYITSDDMIGKSGVWAHFGSWDFERAQIYTTLKKKGYKNNLDSSVKFLKERFNYSDSEAEDIYYEVQSITDSKQANDWIAPWPGYAGTIGCGKVDNSTYICGNFIFNMTSKDLYAETTDGKMYPSKLSIMTDEDVIVKEYDEKVITLQNGRGLGIGMIKNGESYTLLQMDEDLTASMFTRLYYMDGIGLSHFKKFSDERSFNGNRIIVWKVDWEGKDKNVLEDEVTEMIEVESSEDKNNGEEIEGESSEILVEETSEDRNTSEDVKEPTLKNTNSSKEKEDILNNSDSTQ